MNTMQTIRILRTLTLAALLGLSSGAHALCVNADGSLDDSSMNTALVDRGLLPACEVEKPAPAKTVGSQAAKTEAPTTKPDAAPKAAKKAKRPDGNASIQGDCRTTSGESREGTLGAVDMLPACSA